METYQDRFSTTFSSFPQMYTYHQQQAASSLWKRCRVNTLQVEALDSGSSLAGNITAFAEGTTANAVADTAENLGLAIRVDGSLYPVRETAYKGLLDRAKINGTALPKLRRADLASVLNSCLHLFGAEALVLVREQKVSAVHSGDAVDYSVLPIDSLLNTLQAKLDARFPGNQFEFGYADHAISSASWKMPAQKEDLLGSYARLLAAQGKGTMASKLTPGIRFLTSDTGIASAKVSALLMGGQYPIHIGSCIAVDHRHQTGISNFDAALDQLFAQFGKSVEQLQKLMEVQLMYPVNAMARVCKKLSMPKKAALEAISMYEMAYGGDPATAHDIFMAMQEIPFILKSEGVPESKLIALEENMARALTLKWSDYDLAKAVAY